MEYELSQAELGQILRATRVLSPDYTEEQFQSLVAAQQKLTDAGFLDAVWGMVRLQQEKDISCSEAIDAYQELLIEKTKLENELATLKEKHNEAEKAYQQVMINISVAKNELRLIRKDIKEEERQLTTLIKDAESEKKRINDDLEQCRQSGGVTMEDIAIAGKLKAEIENSGFSLEMMLGLAREFAPYQNARDRLAESLNTYHSLTEHIATLEKNATEQEKALTTVVNGLLSQTTGEERKVNHLKDNCRQLEINLSRLQVDVEQEQQMRQFYVRYNSVSNLMEYLASWRQVLFLRCDNPFCDPFAGINHIWTDKPARRCPHCGMGNINPDSEPYRLLNLPAGMPFKLNLG